MDMRDEKTKSLKEIGELDFHDDCCDYIVAVPCIKLRDEGEVDGLFTNCIKKLRLDNNITCYGQILINSMEMGHHLKTSIDTD
jgi:hypothetical protein